MKTCTIELSQMNNSQNSQNVSQSPCPKLGFIGPHVVVSPLEMIQVEISTREN